MRGTLKGARLAGGRQLPPRGGRRRRGLAGPRRQRRSALRSRLGNTAPIAFPARLTRKPPPRKEERRGGKERVRKGKTRVWDYHKKQQKTEAFMDQCHRLIHYS